MDVDTFHIPKWYNTESTDFAIKMTNLEYNQDVLKPIKLKSMSNEEEWSSKTIHCSQAENSVGEVNDEPEYTTNTEGYNWIEAVDTKQALISNSKYINLPKE